MLFCGHKQYDVPCITPPCMCSLHDAKRDFGQNLGNGPSAKLVPLLVMILCGYPYLRMISFRNFTAVLPSHFRIGLASIHFVNLSTITKMWVMLPRAGLNRPTMSRHQTANGHVKEMVLSAVAGMWLLFANRWHPPHLRTSSLACCRAVGQ